MTTKIDDTRLDEATELAEAKFWASIAESYPEATFGDLEPDIVVQLQNIMRQAVHRWVRLNVPDIAPQQVRPFATVEQVWDVLRDQLSEEDIGRFELPYPGHWIDFTLHGHVALGFDHQLGVWSYLIKVDGFPTTTIDLPEDTYDPTDASSVAAAIYRACFPFKEQS